MEKTRLNEIAYGVLLIQLGHENFQLNPQGTKRRLGNLVGQLSNVGIEATKEEVQEAARVVFEDLVKHAFDFTFKEKEKKK